MTSAPRKITGCWNTEGLQNKKKKKSAKSHLQMNSWCSNGPLFLFQLHDTERLSYQVLQPDLNNEIFVC